MKFKSIFYNRILQLTEYNNLEYEYLKQNFTLSGWNYRKGKKIKWEKTFLQNGTFLSSGFLLKLRKFAQEKGFNINIDGIENFVNPKYDKEFITEWVQSQTYKKDYIVPRWYQTDALYYSQRYKFTRGDFATGSGKTFICYLVSRFILEQTLQQKNKKVLMVVPSVQLVSQTRDDWFDNFQNDDFIKLDIRCGELPKEANENGNVILGNIDSLTNLPKEFFKDVGAIIYDEAHKLTTNGYKKIFDYCQGNNLDMIYSVSGSWYEDGTVEDFECEEISGSILIRVTAKDLMNEGTLTPVKVNEIPFMWDYETSKGYYNHADCQVTEFKNIRNHFELEYIRSQQKRIDFIVNLIGKFENNQLLLFKSKKYLREFEKILKERYPDKEILVIVGEVSGKKRDEIKKYTETNNNVIILATYGTMSTGVSINNLSTLHFVEPPKSFIWVRQSIGRMVRLHKSKQFALIISYTDIFKKYDRNWLGGHRNISHGHLTERVNIYKQQNFDYKVLNPINL